MSLKKVITTSLTGVLSLVVVASVCLAQGATQDVAA